jgi:hypothetical protein
VLSIVDHEEGTSEFFRRASILFDPLFRAGKLSAG